VLIELPIDIEPGILHHDIEKYGRECSFSKGELLFTPEEMCKEFFFVLDGRIKVSQVNSKDAKEQTLKILTRGDMYDVITLLDHKTHDNLLYALDEVKIIVFPIDIVRTWMHKNSDFNKLLFPYIANQFRDMEEQVLDLSFYEVSQRLSKLLVKNLNNEHPGELNLIYNLPHEEIASLIGTTRKVLNRHLQVLKRDKVIDVNYKNIQIKDTQKLLNQLSAL
jgi:CRP/FNR family cyclic AMP-dependent transcriptional regulator